MNWTLLQNSLLLALVTTVSATLAGAAGATFAVGLKRKWQTLLVAIAVAAFALPPFLLTNTWLNYFGLAGSWRQYLDFDIYSFPGAVLLLSLQLWPIAFILVLARLGSVDPVYLEQEPNLRALQLWRFLLWPLCRPALLNAAVLIFVLALNNFSIPTLLQRKVYPAEVWLSFNTRFDYFEALRLSWPLILGPFLLILFFQAHPVRFAQRNRQSSPALLATRIGWPARTVGAAALALLVLLSLVLPFAQLLFSARMWTEFLPAFAAARNGFVNSFLFAACSAALVLLAGILFRKRAWPIASWLFLLAPGLLLGIALIFLLNRPWSALVYQSFAVVVVAYTIRFFALGWAGSRLAHQQADPALSEMTRSLGAGFWQQFRLVEWPASGKYLLGIAYFVYLLCLWDVETLIFVVPPGGETIALRVFNMLHYGHANQVDALCVWLLLVAIAPLALWAVWNSLAPRKHPLPIFASFLFATGCSVAPGTGSEVRHDLFSNVEVIGSRGTGPGHFNKPRSLALDAQDNLYVVDLTGRVQKFSPEGEFLLAWQMPQTDKGKPKGMIQDSHGGVIVIEPHYSRVNHFTPAGNLAHQWGNYGTNAGQLTFPRSAAINSHGEIYLTEYGLKERVQRFSARGESFLGTFGAPGTEPGKFNRPEGVGVDPDDQVYVADSCNHRVQIFNRDGALVTTFGTPGSGPGEMSYPYDVRVDAAGNIFVCEFGNSRIQIFTPELEPAGSLGGAGINPGQMNNPWSIALDSHGNLFVADAGNHRVQKFIRKEPLKGGKSLQVSFAK